MAGKGFSFCRRWKSFRAEESGAADPGLPEFGGKMPGFETQDSLLAMVKQFLVTQVFSF